MLDLRYKHVEAALAVLFDVPDVRMKAFRAQLRHFRNLGVPALPKVGSGTQITYTDDHVHQLFLALEMHRLDMSPATIARFIQAKWADLSPALRAAVGAQREHLLALQSGTRDPGADENVPAYIGSYFPENIGPLFLDAGRFYGGAPLMIFYLTRRLNDLHKELAEVARSRWV